MIHHIMGIKTAGSGFKVVYDAAGRTELTEQRDGFELRLAVPWLAGPSFESLDEPDSILRRDGPFVIAESAETTFGAAVVPAMDGLEAVTEDLYRHLLSVCQGRHLHRIWNYVPQINQMQAGLERYQQFNIGRWIAFEERFGRDLRSFMPAASAVGIGGGHLALLFSAGRKRPVFFENPNQVPAYHYPPDYGPRPPGFARGVVADDDNAGTRTIFLSGTASIEGHRSIGEGDWATQFRTTMHNIETMLERMGVPEALEPSSWRGGVFLNGGFKCYLRHPESLNVFQEFLAEETGLSEAQCTFVQADICRMELDLEIEATITIRHPAGRLPSAEAAGKKESSRPAPAAPALISAP